MKGKLFFTGGKEREKGGRGDTLLYLGEEKEEGEGQAEKYGEKRVCTERSGRKEEPGVR